MHNPTTFEKKGYWLSHEQRALYQRPAMEDPAQVCKTNSRISRGRSRVVIAATGIFQPEGEYNPYNPGIGRVHVLPN